MNVRGTIRELLMPIHKELVLQEILEISRCSLKKRKFSGTRKYVLSEKQKRVGSASLRTNF